MTAVSSPPVRQTSAPVTPLDKIERDTITRIFYGGVDRFGGMEALRFKRDGTWRSMTYREVEQRVARVAAALDAWGLAPGDRVAILSENRPEWAVADYATLALGAVVVTMYPTLPPDQVAVLLRDSGARFIFVSTTAQADKVAAIRDQLPTLERVIAFDPPETSAESNVLAPSRQPRAGPGLAPRTPAAGPGRDARLARHDHLYVGHHRGPQGRDADAHEPRGHRGGVPPARGTPGGAGTGSPLIPAAVSHLRAGRATTTSGTAEWSSRTRNRSRRCRPTCWKSGRT